MQMSKMGFRKGQSCSDQIFTLTTILRNRKAQGKQTYVAYLDAEKAFDRVDRNLLLYKLLNMWDIWKYVS
jgi:hypothetical protein